MRIRFLDDDCTRVQVTRGLLRKRSAVLKRTAPVGADGEWFYENGVNAEWDLSLKLDDAAARAVRRQNWKQKGPPV